MDKEKIFNTGRILLEILGEIYDIACGESMPISKAALRKMRRNLPLNQNEYFSAIQGLRATGYLEKDNSNDFVITPKGICKAFVLKIESEDWKTENWDGKWRVVMFDIPETMRSQRNIFRSILKRKDFYQLQKSVFVAPFADFELLDKLRFNLKIEKYVNCFIAESAIIDDDKKLRERFNL